MSALLQLDHVRVAYGNIVAAEDASFELAEGELLALLGPNGAGKSSLIGATCGLVVPVAGTITFGGRRIIGQPAHTLARRGMRLVPEGRALFPDMSVRENLLVGGYGRRKNEVEQGIADAIELFPVLGQRFGQLAGTLSGGEQQMLSIARALTARPRLLVLDEPSMGLAPKITAQIIETLADLRNEGLTILISEQNASSVLDIADKAVILSNGAIVGAGAPADIVATLEDTYFGAGAETGTV